jgi:N-formylglutamate deformylase
MALRVWSHVRAPRADVLLRGSRPTEHDPRYERLTAEDLGLPPQSPLPLRFRPAERWSPLVVSFPHVGLRWPSALRPKPQVDLRRNADYEVHRLYDPAAQLGAASVQALYSRLVVDLNRAADDVSPAIVPDHPAPRPRRTPGVPADHGAAPPFQADRPGRGVVWASAVGNVRILHAPLSFAAFRERIDRYHAPYHRALEVLLARRVERFGFAILLDAHSMPASVGPDLVLGTLDGSSCAASVEDLALRALASADHGALDVRLNDPYRGGELVRRFGRPDRGMHALQLEVSRGLYMDEATHAVWPTPVAAASRPGTSDAPARETPIGTHADPARPAPRPTPRQARDLASLVARVTCLLRSLAELGGDSEAIGLAERSVARHAGAATRNESASGLSNESFKG